MRQRVMSDSEIAAWLKLDMMLVKDPAVRATSPQVLEAVGRLRQTSVEAERTCVADAAAIVDVAPKGWLMKKNDKGDKKKKKGLLFGGGPKWERVWCALELEAQRLSVFAEPNAAAPLEAISMPSIIKAKPYTCDGKYPYGWALIIKGSQKVPRPVQNAHHNESPNH
jgi:hypothetical protein